MNHSVLSRGRKGPAIGVAPALGTALGSALVPALGPALAPGEHSTGPWSSIMADLALVCGMLALQVCYVPRVSTSTAFKYSEAVCFDCDAMWKEPGPCAIRTVKNKLYYTKLQSRLQPMFGKYEAAKALCKITHTQRLSLLNAIFCNF